MNLEGKAASIAVRTYTEKDEAGNVTGVKHYTLSAITESGFKVTLQVTPDTMNAAFDDLIADRVRAITAQSASAVESFVKDVDAIVAGVGDASARLVKTLKSDLHIRKSKVEPGQQ